MNTESQDPFTLNQTEAGRLVGKTSVWLRDNGCPRADDGTYNAPEVIRWIVAYTNGDNLAAEKLRKQIAILREREQKLRIDNSKADANLANRLELLRWLRLVVRKLRAAAEMIRGLPSIRGADAQRRLNEVLTETVSEIETSCE